MKLGLQVGGLLVALGISAGMALPCEAQKPHANPAPQNRPANKPANPPRAPKQADRPPRNPGGHNAPNANSRPNGNTNPNVNRPPNPNNQTGQRPNYNPNRPPKATVPRKDLTPQQQQNLEKFNRLPPQEQQKLRDRLRAWNQLTPQQQNHVKNDLLPAYRHLPPGRQSAIKSRLDVLQNMPESARNQHLNDPNFTRGMSEEDKAMLRDLGHMHMGAPDPPSE
jgi:hypothetical protein